MACFHAASILFFLTLSILVSACNTYNYCGPQALFVYSDKPKDVKKKKRLVVAAEPARVPVSKMATRVATLRRIMAAQPQPIAAYIIPTSDAHHSEYISPTDARREWVTGFTGSAGSAVVTQSDALLWTDGRYWTQALKEADPALWTLMKQGLPDTPTVEKWLSLHLPRGSVVGADATTLSRDEWAPMEKELATYGIELKPTATNLVDEARLDMDDAPPTRPRNDITPLPIQYTGRSAGDKIKDLRKQMEEKKTSALVVTALDEIAYLLNLRGTDVQYNPVFFSYLVLTKDKVKLFWGDGFIPDHVLKHLEQEGVQVEGGKYRDIETYLVELAQTLSKQQGETGDIHSMWVSSQSSEAVHRAASGATRRPGDGEQCNPCRLPRELCFDELTHEESLLPKPLTLVSGVSPVALMKAYKNDVELEGFRQSHIRDGVAVVRFLHWLEKEMEQNNTVTEVQASEKILEFRSQEKDFMGPSFETISATGPNAAIIHYTPNPQEHIVINKDTFYLVDSGGHYRDGTTDITRTRHYGAITAPQRDEFTRALRGQIALGAALFPNGVKGNTLDTLARKALWDVGLDYAHGTGHGVGHYLNVHEGPQGVSWRPYPHDPGLGARMILSNEPGFYKDGHYGIRHEDLVEIINVNETTAHPRKASVKGEFGGRGVLGFSTITMVPHQRSCIDATILDSFDIAYLNSYHQTVLNKLKPILLERGLDDVAEWLEEECRPIDRQQMIEDQASIEAKNAENIIEEAVDLAEKKSEEYETHASSAEKRMEQAGQGTEGSEAEKMGEDESRASSAEKRTEQVGQGTEGSEAEKMGEDESRASSAEKRTEQIGQGTEGSEVEKMGEDESRASSAEKRTEQVGQGTEGSEVEKMGEDESRASSAEKRTEQAEQGTEDSAGKRAEVNETRAFSAEKITEGKDTEDSVVKKTEEYETRAISAENRTQQAEKHTEASAVRKTEENEMHASSAEKSSERADEDIEAAAVNKMEKHEHATSAVNRTEQAERDTEDSAVNKTEEYETNATSAEKSTEQAGKEMKDSEVKKMEEDATQTLSTENTTKQAGKETSDSAVKKTEEIETQTSIIKYIIKEELSQENITQTLNKYKDDTEKLLTVKKRFIQTDRLEDKVTSTPFPFKEIQLERDERPKKGVVQTDKRNDQIISTPFPFKEIHLERDERLKKGVVQTDKRNDKIISAPFPFKEIHLERDERLKKGVVQIDRLKDKIIINTPFPFNEIKLERGISLNKGDENVEDSKERIEQTSVDGKVDENEKQEVNIPLHGKSFLKKVKKGLDKVLKETKRLNKGKKVLHKVLKETKGLKNSLKGNKTLSKLAVKKNKLMRKFDSEVTCACNRTEEEIIPLEEKKRIRKNTKKFGVRRLADLLPFMKKRSGTNKMECKSCFGEHSDV